MTCSDIDFFALYFQSELQSTKQIRLQRVVSRGFSGGDKRASERPAPMTSIALGGPARVLKKEPRSGARSLLRRARQQNKTTRASPVA